MRKRWRQVECGGVPRSEASPRCSLPWHSQSNSVMWMAVTRPVFSRDAHAWQVVNECTRNHVRCPTRSWRVDKTYVPPAGEDPCLAPTGNIIDSRQARKGV